MEAAPIQPQPLRRIDEQDELVAEEIAALVRSANSPDRRDNLRSKSRPKGNSDALSPGHAAWILGLIYLHGAGVEQNAALAQTWFERALELGSSQALAGAAWCAIDGCRGMPTPAKADQWTKPLEAVNRPRALYLEWLANERLAPLQTARPTQPSQADVPTAPASKLLLSAARSGDLHAQIELGLIAMANRQPATALKYFEQAAPRSSVAAINAAIVVEAMQSPPTPQSDGNKLAIELLNEARRFHRGEGRPVNYSEAIRLYRLAAAKGNPEAEHMLALIYSRPMVNGSFDVAWISQLGELDLSQVAPRLRAPTQKRQLQRERTALVDLLPAKWRSRIL
jgi:uncharacterized protein